MAEASSVDHFVKAVHRRMVLLRSAERVGLCALGGCVMLLVLMPILLYRGQPAAELAGVVMGCAMGAGLIWAVMTRPGRLAAAMEADRQLKLADLLGTAWLIGRRSGNVDDLERAVVALAEARCRAASPSMVALHRFGARGWGGIGLAGAMVFGLALMGPDSAQNQASAAHGTKSWQEVERENEKLNPTRTITKLDMRRVHEGSGSDEDPAANQNQTETNDAARAPAPDTKGGDSSETGGADHGSGAAAGQSHEKTSAKPAAETTTAGENKTAGQGGQTAGGGDTAAQGSGATGKSGTSGGGGKGRRPAPIWQSENWPADQEAARAALRSGQVPDAYREMVREYFERE